MVVVRHLSDDVLLIEWIRPADEISLDMSNVNRLRVL